MTNTRTWRWGTQPPPGRLSTAPADRPSRLLRQYGAFAVMAVRVFQRGSLALQIFGRAQPRIPDRGVFRSIRELAIPAREVAQLLGLVHKSILSCRNARSTRWAIDGFPEG